MQKLLRRVYASHKASLVLKIISYISVIASMLCYAFLLYFAYAEGGIPDAVKLILVGGIPFVLVSLLRELVDAPRPYEIYDFYTVRPKERAGRSFPSRHVFSAFLVASLAISVSVPLAAAMVALGAALGAARALLGIHFVRDVAVGAALGLIFGALGIVI